MAQLARPPRSDPSSSKEMNHNPRLAFCLFKHQTQSHSFSKTSVLHPFSLTCDKWTMWTAFHCRLASSGAFVAASSVAFAPGSAAASRKAFETLTERLHLFHLPHLQHRLHHTISSVRLASDQKAQQLVFGSSSSAASSASGFSGSASQASCNFVNPQ